jgi:hypothetical protein
MGHYINWTSKGVPVPALGKASFLVKSGDAAWVDLPRSFEDVPQDKLLVVVVSNGLFEAAGIVYSEDEYLAFSNPRDRRPKGWLLIEKVVSRIERMVGCSKETAKAICEGRRN